MAVTADKPSPYAPASAILDLIDRHRQRGLPQPVNSEVLERAGISDSLIPRTLYALQVLDLIAENGTPTPTFEGIRLAPEAEFKKRLEDWLKAAYADVFAFTDPSKDDETSIRDAFRSYQPIGQQGRMVTLFQGLCTAAGLILEKSQQPAVRAGPTTSRPRPPAQPTIRRGQQGAQQKTPPANVRTDMPAALAGLLASLPPEGSGWTQAKRDKFVSTFGTVLDFCFPIVVTDANGANENGGPQ